MKKFTDESMYEIIEYFQNELEKKNQLSLEVLNPDHCINEYSGFEFELSQKYITILDRLEIVIKEIIKNKKD
jgi:hypothetical protein